MGLNSNCAPSLAANMILGWKSVTVTSTLAYLITAKITAVKSFIENTQGGAITISRMTLSTKNYLG
jgi:hypothetical protein